MVFGRLFRSWNCGRRPASCWRILRSREGRASRHYSGHEGCQPRLRTACTTRKNYPASSRLGHASCLHHGNEGWFKIGMRYGMENKAKRWDQMDTNCHRWLRLEPKLLEDRNLVNKNSPVEAFFVNKWELSNPNQNLTSRKDSFRDSGNGSNAMWGPPSCVSWPMLTYRKNRHIIYLPENHINTSYSSFKPTESYCLRKGFCPVLFPRFSRRDVGDHQKGFGRR